MTNPTPRSTAAVAAAALGACAYATLAPRSSWWCPTIWHGDRAGPARVALTFDDVPSPGSTEAVLDALGEAGVPAAFFVIGLNAAWYPAILRRIHNEGHLIGNHSYDHHHAGVTRFQGYWEDQLGRTDAQIRDQTGQRPLLFRPPWGSIRPRWHGPRTAADSAS